MQVEQQPPARDVPWWRRHALPLALVVTALALIPTALNGWQPTWYAWAAAIPPWIALLVIPDRKK